MHCVSRCWWKVVYWNHDIIARACIMHVLIFICFILKTSSLPIGLGMGTERPQTCGVPLFKTSPSRRALNSLPLVSSDALTPLVRYMYICKLRLHNLEITWMYCTISRLAHNFWILRMCSAISRLCKFLDCAEHVYPLWGKQGPHCAGYLCTW